MWQLMLIAVACSSVCSAQVSPQPFPPRPNTRPPPVPRPAPRPPPRPPSQPPQWPDPRQPPPPPGLFPQGPGLFGPPYNPMLEGRRDDPTYLILASKKVRPGSVYRVVVHLFKSESPINVRAAMSRDGIEVASNAEILEGQMSSQLLLRVPSTSIPGTYRLRVEGSTNAISKNLFGGLLFANETEIDFSSRFLTILIQTNRPVYNRLQIVRFRIFMLTTELKPYTDAVEVTVLDPKGYVMRKWFSAHSNVGTVTLQLNLPSDPVQGYWSINVAALGQTQKQVFLVEKYWPARFEVNVMMPMFLLESSKYIYGTVHANYTYLYSPIIGNATIKLTIQQSKFHYEVNNGVPLLEQTVPYFNGSYNFKFPMENLWQTIPQLDGSVIKVEATVYDKVMDMYNSGFVSTRITNSTVRLRFLGSEIKVFKPGMPLQVYLAVSYHDFVPLPTHKLKNSKLQISSSFTMRTGGSQRLPYMEERVPENGIIKLEFDTPPVAGKIMLQATYTDVDGDRSQAEATFLGYYSHQNRYVHVYTSTRDPKIGEYIVFHVRNNFYMEHFNYVIMSKGIIVASGTEEMEAVMQSVKTFAIPVSSEMAPSCRIIVYHITKDGELLSDALLIPIDAISRNKISLELNPYKDKSGKTVELRVKGDAGAFFGVSVMDSETAALQGGNELSPAMVMESMHTFDSDYKRINKVLWTSREGEPERAAYFTTFNYGGDSNKTFNLAGLVIFTDANISSYPDTCRERGLLSCMDGSCHNRDQVCDGTKNCANGYDENGCIGGEAFLNNLRDFRLTRKNHIERFYDRDHGDWSWINFNLAPEGHEFFSIGPVPRRPARWMLNAVSMSNKFGLGILQQPYEYEGLRPFFATAEMPSICTRGEQVGVRVDVFNMQPFETYVLLVLKDSKDYKFVHVEADGIVRSYNPRTSSGEHHHLIWVHSKQTFTVYIPIVSTHVGTFDVVIEAFTHVGSDKIVRRLTVEPDGMLQTVHTSMMIDLKNQPRSIKFVDINVTETPIVPYFRWRRYIYESPRASVSVVGDVVGPAFPKMPVTANILLRKPDRSAEMQAFNFAANLWTLHYLRLTNQLQLAQAKEAFKHLNIFYSWIMAYMRTDGSFAMWKGYESSVWLTQYIVRIFERARFPDWELYLYIDPLVIQNAVAWILKFQTREGSFYENTLYPLDRKLDPRFKRLNSTDNYRLTNISLTAHVLITLCETANLPGELRLRVSNAKIMATKYLERLLSSIEDPYELAVSTYALVQAGSPDAENGINMLDSIKREQEGFVYWGKEDTPPISIRMENQRPYIQPRFPFKYDALNVETSAYALLVFMPKEEGIQEKIVFWLNSMRTSDGGFISTQDTIVAMQALIQFTFQFRIRDITDMRIKLNATSTPGLTKTVLINEQNLAQIQTMKITNVWGHIPVDATGSGLAILQLDCQYSVDYKPLIIQPPMKAFELNIQARFSGRNASILAMKSCQRWTNLAESPASGAAVLEMDVPTGYYQYQPMLDAIVFSEKQRGNRNLRRIKITERKLHVYFSYLDNRFTCIDFNLQRWLPVANMTQYMRMRVYDYYAPERYNESMLDMVTLYALAICDVCGSYQCPYCPYFSAGTNIEVTFLVLLATLLTSCLSCFLVSSVT